MYTHELPIDINIELCRLLDTCDYWKELASKMEYSTFDINEIAQVAKRLGNSPTHQLFLKWSHLNLTVEVLFLLLCRMKYVPAVRCLKPLVDIRQIRELNKKNGLKKENVVNDENRNVNATERVDGTQSSTPSPGQTSKSTQECINTADEIIRMGIIPQMSYEELKIATDNWNEANLLGHGGFAKVYKGEWIHSKVAVKRLNGHMKKELLSELILNQYRHENILPLYGYSVGGPHTCIVYQLMAGGSLGQRLRCRTSQQPFTWPQRYRVAHGVASGLLFLHNCTIPLIHGDIKPGNILLDQYLTPKIGDFGLVNKGPKGDMAHMKVSRKFGTPPYLPEEYIRSNVLSPAVDVFSFGVVLLEMATALPSFDRTRASPNLSDYISTLTRNNMNFEILEDPVLRGTAHSNPPLCCQFIQLGEYCTRNKRIERPTMLTVYKLLDSINFPGKL